VLGAVAFGAWYVLDDALGRSFAAQLVSLGSALVVGGIAYVIACKALGVREIAALLSLRDRFRRA
jgi:predicted phage tail protein